MSEKDGARWIGRFIKKNGNLFKIVRVHDYIFRDMNSFSAPIMDNQSVNIIHKRLHDEEELNTYVRKHETFNNSLQDPNSKGSVIFPRDFTSDWNIQAKRLSDRHERDDDEDDDDDEQYQEASKKTFKSESLASTTPENIHLPIESNIDASELQSEPVQDIPKTLEPLSQIPVLNIIKDELSDLDLKGELIKDDETVHVSTDPEESKEIEPLPPPVSENSQELKDVLAQISQIKETFKGLRKEILLEAQDQFFEITKMLCESLLEKQIEIDKTVFVDLIKRALAEAMPSDEFQIFVSTKFFKKLDDLNLGDFQKHFHQDESLSETSFRIESKDSRLETSLKDLTTKLLNQIEGSIFTNQMASTSKG